MQKIMLFLSLSVIANVSAEQASIIPLVIVGAGPAGYAAANFCALSHVKAILVAGPEPGGQLIRAQSVENIPWFSGSGYDLMSLLERKIIDQGIPIIYKAAVNCHKDDTTGHYVITLDDGTQLRTLAVIAATGATPNKLGVPGEAQFWARGVYTCAVCDGFAVKRKKAIVVGGGDVAIEHALHLARQASAVTIVVRSNHMRAIAHMRDKITEHPNVTILFNTQITEILGTEKVSGVRVYHRDTQQEEVLSADGIFLAIGSTPNSGWLTHVITPHANGSIPFANGITKATLCPGIFSAGELSDTRYRRADSAFAQGSEAAFDAIEYLNSVRLDTHKT